MRASRLPEWALPVRGVGFWAGLLRVVVFSAVPIAIVSWLGRWGLLALPLLLPVVWLVEAVTVGISHLLGRANTH